METWLKITLMLCVYGVLKEIRPSEPFITKYLTNPPMNFTYVQVVQDIYPVSIYSMLVPSIVIFLITDLVRYKPIIILLSTSAMSVYLLLIFGRSLFIMKVDQVLYGLFSVCEVAYYTYIYAKVDKSHYQEVTGYTRAAYLVGRTVSGLIAQFLVSSGFSYYSLNVVTFCALTLSAIWALFLPPVESSIYFNPVNIEPATGDRIKTSCGEKLAYGFKKLWVDFVKAFKSFYVIKWAFWWALATCCYYQILHYIQPLWEQILKEYPQDGGNLNGAVEFTYTLISAAGAYGFGKVQADWAKYGELVLCLGSLLICGVLITMACTSSIYLAYGTYIIYAAIYNSMMTISNSEVAKMINPDSYGLIFGFTTSIALLMQTLLTIVVIEDMALEPRPQFMVYGGYFGVLSAIFAVKTVYDLIRKVFSSSGSSTS